jgi:hypothetical protein
LAIGALQDFKGHRFLESSLIGQQKAGINNTHYCLITERYFSVRKYREEEKHRKISKLHPGYIRFGAFTAVTMKNAVFWDIKPQFIPQRKHITSPL